MDLWRRARPRRWLLVLVVLAAASSLTVPVAAVTLTETDVAAITSRADQWTQARTALRAAAHEQALSIAADAREAELDRIAAEEAARLAEAERRAAEEAAARTTTTTAAPTTTLPPTTTAPATTAPATVPPSEPVPTTTAAPVAGDPTPAQWEVLRQCESSGNYSIVNPNGRYRGAYQFSQATWDWIAGLDYPALVGVDPAAAAPADQDAMALALWRRRGWSPWPICGQRAAAA